MQNEIIALANDFIRIPYVSGSGNIEQAIALLDLSKKQLTEYPFTPFVSNGIPSLLFRNKEAETKQFKIILNAHLDVVPANKKAFLPYKENGKLYGRGAKDMKAATAALILLFKEIGHALPYQFGLQIVMDEETGGNEGTQYQLNQGILTEFAISGEGTNLHIVNEAKTRLILKLIAVGKSSHGAYPWLGDNAILKLQQALQIILEKFPPPKTESENTTVNITHIGTENTIFNKTPQHCEAILDIRYTHDDTNIIEHITSLLPEGVRREIIDHWPTHYTPPTNPYIKLLQQEASNLLGGILPLARAHGTSDMPFYTKIGCEGIEFGPIGANHHAENEWVDIESLDNYYHILKQFLFSLAKETIATTSFKKAQENLTFSTKPSLLYEKNIE